MVCTRFFECLLQYVHPFARAGNDFLVVFTLRRVVFPVFKHNLFGIVHVLTLMGDLRFELDRLPCGNFSGTYLKLHFNRFKRIGIGRRMMVRPLRFAASA
ncbi:hypothetical protein D1872_313610 [compost metagenome]